MVVRLDPFQRIVAVHGAAITHAAIGVGYDFPGDATSGNGGGGCSGTEGDPFDEDLFGPLNLWSPDYLLSVSRDPIPITTGNIFVNVFNGHSWGPHRYDFNVSGQPSAPIALALSAWAAANENASTEVVPQGGGDSGIILPEGGGNFSSATGYDVTWFVRGFSEGPQCFVAGPIFGPPGGGTSLLAKMNPDDSPHIPAGADAIDFSGVTITLDGKSFICVGSQVLNQQTLSFSLLFQKA